MLRVHDLRHEYDGETVLRVPRFEAEAGSRWALVGLSGSGKTTLLHVLAGILRPTEGRVEVAGTDLASLKGAALDRFRGEHIGIVFQRLHLVRTLTVEENLLLAQRLGGSRRDAARVRSLLGALDLGGKLRALPGALSAGQRQRVAFARAVINRPALILADEPTASLDDVRAAQVLDLLDEQARAAEATLLVATHDARVRARFPAALVLAGGSAAIEGGPSPAL